MISTRLTICAVALLALPSPRALAAPAYVKSTVHLRAGASTENESLGKIPAGSLVNASNCSEWCEVEWQDKKGFSIATALDTSGRVPSRRTAPSGPRHAYGPVGPRVYYRPRYYYAYRPYWYGYYGPWGYRRWRPW